MQSLKGDCTLTSRSSVQYHLLLLFKESKVSFESGRNGALCVYFFISPHFGHVQTLPDLKNTLKK